MKKIIVACGFLILSNMGFSVTLNSNAVNVSTINANAATTFIADRTKLSWILVTKAKAYINIYGTASPTVESLPIYPGVYNELRLAANQTSFKILGTATENITIYWNNPAMGLTAVASGYDNEKTVRAWVSGSTTTTTDVPASQYLVVANDSSTANLTVTLSGPSDFSLTYTLLPQNVMDEKFQAFTRFVITATGSWRAYTRR